jgi:hypothetical protein
MVAEDVWEMVDQDFIDLLEAAAYAVIQSTAKAARCPGHRLAATSLPLTPRRQSVKGRRRPDRPQPGSEPAATATEGDRPIYDGYSMFSN